MSMGRNNMKAALEGLGEKDVYTLAMYALYSLKGSPEYATLSELAYVMDWDSLTRFLRVFEGATIKVPPLHDLEVVLKALVAFVESDLEGKPLASAITDSSAGVQRSEVAKAYSAIKEAVAAGIPAARADDGD